MKYKVPFYKQPIPMSCGQTALKIASSYFGKDIDIIKLGKIIGVKKGKSVSTVKLAIASKKLGFETDFYSISLESNPELFEMEFYKKNSEQAGNYEELIEKAKKLGVNVKQKSLSLEELTKSLNESSIPIVLLDWNVVRSKEEKGYQGHFVPVVGYTLKNIYVHNPALNNPQPFLKIEKGLFERARKAKGTDEDLVIIHNPKTL